jgi:hypothetical protein
MLATESESFRSLRTHFLCTSSHRKHVASFKKKKVGPSVCMKSVLSCISKYKLFEKYFPKGILAEGQSPSTQHRDLAPFTSLATNLQANAQTQDSSSTQPVTQQHNTCQGLAHNIMQHTRHGLQQQTCKPIAQTQCAKQQDN